MTAIGNLGLSQTVTANSTAAAKSAWRKEQTYITPGPFKKTVTVLTPEDIEHRQEVRERAEQKRDEVGGRWMSNPLFKDDPYKAPGYTVNKSAINMVREKLKEEGIDPSKRTPTHEITDEQLERLAEKYDLEYLNMAGMNDPEYGNFLLDLAYMNVFSCDELECNFAGIGVPVGVLYCIETYDGSKAGYYIWNDQHFKSYDDVVKAYQMDYIRTQDPGQSENYYQAKYEDIMAKTQERMHVLNDFFDRASRYSYPGLADAPKPKIEDASGKLKEDFGKVLA